MMSFKELRKEIIECALVRKEPIDHIIIELVAYCQMSKKLFKAEQTGLI